MNIFSFIKDKISILEIIGQYTTLKKAGTYWKGPCPFHSEKTGSFTVSPHKEMFYCFGCQAGGDIITFVSKIENCTPIEAVQLLADRYALDLPETIKNEVKQTTSHKEHYSAVCKAIALWCHRQLLYNKPALEYLIQRGMSEKTIVQFSLGYMPTGLRALKQLVDDMARESILFQDLLDCAFLVQGKNVMYSPYEDRIIFPIKDYVGRFCGFGGRVYKVEDTRPKYYNSKEHDYFIKGSILFGLHEAKKEIQKSGVAFLVEGYMDCISMVQHGYTNTVATLGTSCTLAHLKLLSRYAQELFVLYDGDAAGHNAILKLAELCWQATLTLKIVQLPEGQDPDSFLRTGNDLNPYIAAAQDIFFFFIETMGKDFAQKPVHEKVALSKHLLTIIKTVDDSFTKDLLLQQASKTLDIPFDSLRHELNRTRPPVLYENRQKDEAPEQEVFVETPALGSLEKKIFCAILQNIGLLQDTHHKMLIYHIIDPYKAILESRINLYMVHNVTDFNQFFATLNGREQQLVSKVMLEEPMTESDTTFDQLVIHLHKKQWKMMVKKITQQLHQAKSTGDEVRVQEILQDFLKLKEKIVPNVTQGTQRGSDD